MPLHLCIYAAFLVTVVSVPRKKHQLLALSQIFQDRPSRKNKWASWEFVWAGVCTPKFRRKLTYLETRRDSFTLLREVSPFKWFKIRKCFNDNFLKQLLHTQTGWMKKFFLSIRDHVKSLHVLFPLSGLPRPHLCCPVLSGLWFLTFWNCLCLDRKLDLFPASRFAHWILCPAFLVLNSAVFLWTNSPYDSLTETVLQQHKILWGGQKRKKMLDMIKSHRPRGFCFMPAILKAKFFCLLVQHFIRADNVAK